MKVESTTECSPFDLHKVIIGLEKQFQSFIEWPFYTGFTVNGLQCSIMVRTGP